MTDPTFDPRLARRMLAYTEEAVGPFDPLAIAEAGSRGQKSRSLRSPTVVPRIPLPLAPVFALLVLAVVVGLIVVSLAGAFGSDRSDLTRIAPTADVIPPSATASIEATPSIALVSPDQAAALLPNGADASRVQLQAGGSPVVVVDPRPLPATMETLYGTNGFTGRVWQQYVSLGDNPKTVPPGVTATADIVVDTFASDAGAGAVAAGIVNHLASEGAVPLDGVASPPGWMVTVRQTSLVVKGCPYESCVFTTTFVVAVSGNAVVESTTTCGGCDGAVGVRAPMSLLSRILSAPAVGDVGP